MDKQIYNPIIQPKGETLIYRTGPASKAIEPVEPMAFNIKGNIEAPAIWATEKGKTIDSEYAYAIFDSQSYTIALHLNNGQEKGKKHSTVVGDLKSNPRLLSFHINENHKWGLRPLADHLKFNRRYFSEPENAAKVVSGLKNFTATLNSRIEKASDDRGSKRSLVDRTFESNVPQAFILTMPIVEGYPSKTFTVELLIDGSEDGARVWLQSVDLDDLITESVKSIMDDQEKVLIEHDITVIHK